ncbi:MAG: hypothetical protein AAGE43_10860 [Pseudomonadota bacterium]
MMAIRGERTGGRSFQPRLSGVLIFLAVTACGDPSAERGLYYYGGEVNVVCPCGGDSCYWVRGAAAVLDPMKRFVLKNAATPYQPMYLQYRGEALKETPVGFAANYDGLYRIDSVLAIDSTLPADCQAR